MTYPKYSTDPGTGNGRHWHVWDERNAEDDGQFVPIDDVYAAAVELASRASFEADYLTDTAHAYAADESFRDAWFSMKNADRMSDLARNAGRYEEYRDALDGGRPEENPPLFRDTNNRTELLTSVLWTVGHVPGHDGERTDTSPFYVYPCAESTCAEWVDGYTDDMGLEQRI